MANQDGQALVDKAAKPRGWFLRSVPEFVNIVGLLAGITVATSVGEVSIGAEIGIILGFAIMSILLAEWLRHSIEKCYKHDEQGKTKAQKSS